jgi:hypothetical protein
MSLTVTALIEQLKLVKNPDTTIVVQSVDSEGNSIRHTEGIDWTAAFHPTSAWEGELHVRGPLTPELERFGYTEEDLAEEDDLECVCFWPIN